MRAFLTVGFVVLVVALFQSTLALDTRLFSKTHKHSVKHPHHHELLQRSLEEDDDKSKASIGKKPIQRVRTLAEPTRWKLFAYDVWRQLDEEQNLGLPRSWRQFGKTWNKDKPLFSQDNGSMFEALATQLKLETAGDAPVKMDVGQLQDLVNIFLAPQGNPAPFAVFASQVKNEWEQYKTGPEPTVASNDNSDERTSKVAVLSTPNIEDSATVESPAESPKENKSAAKSTEDDASVTTRTTPTTTSPEKTTTSTDKATTSNKQDSVQESPKKKQNKKSEATAVSPAKQTQKSKKNKKKAN